MILNYTPPAPLSVVSYWAQTLAPVEPNGCFWAQNTFNMSDGSTRYVKYYAQPGTSLDATVIAAAAQLNATLAASYVPQSVTMSQARAAILAEGLEPAVEAIVAASGSDVFKLWYTSPTLDRNNPFVLSLGTQLGLSPSQIDILFQEAATYEAT